MIIQLFITRDGGRIFFHLMYNNYVNITGIAVEQRPIAQKMFYQQLSILNINVVIEVKLNK